MQRFGFATQQGLNAVQALTFGLVLIQQRGGSVIRLLCLRCLAAGRCKVRFKLPAPTGQLLLVVQHKSRAVMPLQQETQVFVSTLPHRKTVFGLPGQGLVVTLQGCLPREGCSIFCHLAFISCQPHYAQGTVMPQPIQRIVHCGMRLRCQQYPLPAPRQLDDGFCDHRSLTRARRPLNQAQIRCRQNLDHGFFLGRVELVIGPLRNRLQTLRYGNLCSFEQIISQIRRIAALLLQLPQRLLMALDQAHVACR